MTEVERLAAFVTRARYRDMTADAREQLRIRVLDSIGCAAGALDAAPIAAVRAQTEDFGGNPLCTLIGGPGKSGPDRAAFFNGALVRYLDFMDSYLAKGETCHPSDNLAPVLAAAEYADAGGEEFLSALAVAYQVQARLSDEAPVRARGFDHTTQGAYAVGAGVAKALGLDAERTAHAIALSGTGNIALRVTRTGTLSHWKGLAYPNTAFIGTHAAFLAMRGITGPLEVFEGNKGFKDSVSGPFTIDWPAENLERITRTIVKKYNAEIHAQSAIEGALDLKRQHGIRGADVAAVTVAIFDVAHRIIGGGEEGDKTAVATKEQADHSLPYMIAAALCDGELLPAQYAPERIHAPDVQDLLRRVTVTPSAEFSARFPGEMACRVTIALHHDRRLMVEKRDYEGFHTRPMSWDGVVRKFHNLAGPFATADALDAIVDSIARLHRLRVRDLTALLARLHPDPSRGDPP
ncbi:MAG: MmgE/PrpD family protein [Magnetospirillum sp.]|nr:MmgE/PrpD family protein [Magnetospirillum sp.]